MRTGRTSSPGARDLLGTLLVFGVALAVRAVYAWQLSRTPLWDDLPVDLGYYRGWALSILDGTAPRETYEQSPLYAWFLAVIFKLAGDGHFAPRAAQVVLGCLGCVLVQRTARRAFSPGAGLLAGLFAALYGPLVYFDAMPMKVSLAVFFMALALWLVVLSEARRAWPLFAAGLAVGLGALTRDNLILLAPAVVVWLALSALIREDGARPGLRARLPAAAAFAAGVLLVVLPVTARNVAVSGEAVLLTAGGGSNFYIGNNPGADGRYAPPPFVRASSVVEHEDFRVEAARRLGVPRDELSRRDSSRYWFREGVRWIRENPGDFALLLGRKALVFWNGYEQPDNHYYDHHRRLVPVLGLPLLQFWLLAPLAAAGVALSAASWRRLLPLYLVGATYAASVTLFFVLSRYRMPIVPVLLVFAGGAVVGGYRALKARRLVPLLAGVAAFAGVFLVATADPGNDALHVGQGRARLARLLLDAGRPGEAEAEARAGIERLESVYTRLGGRLGEGGLAAPPGEDGTGLGASFFEVLGEAYVTRAEALRWRGRCVAAERVDARAASAGVAPAGARAEERIAAGLARGNAAMNERRFAEAAAAYEGAIGASSGELDPCARLRTDLHLAQALHLAGEPREALRVVDEALARVDEGPPVTLADAHFGKALVLRDLGETEAMKREMEACLALNPAHPRADWMREVLAAGR